MSKSRTSCPRTCGTCARITPGDLNKGYCPISAECIHRNRPADRCKFYVMDEDYGSDGKPRRRRKDVY